MLAEIPKQINHSRSRSSLNIKKSMHDSATRGFSIASNIKGCSCDKFEPSPVQPTSDFRSNNEKSQKTQTNRAKTFARSRQTKMKMRHTFGNHHRLDHTYAATVNFKDVLHSNISEESVRNVDKVLSKRRIKHYCDPLGGQKEKVNITSILSTNDQTAILNEKSHNETESCEEMILDVETYENNEVSIKSSWLRNFHLEYQPTKKIKKSDRQDDADIGHDVKHTRSHFSKSNGILKQYHRNRKVNKNKAESSLGKCKIASSFQEDEKRWIAAQALIELAHSK